MKRVYEYLRKYLIISLLLTGSIFAIGIMNMIRDGNLPEITYHYLFEVVISFGGCTLLLIIPIAYIDLLIVKAAQALFTDFKHADKAGKITIIVVMVILLLRKIVTLT